MKYFTAVLGLSFLTRHRLVLERAIFHQAWVMAGVDSFYSRPSFLQSKMNINVLYSVYCLVITLSINEEKDGIVNISSCS